MNLSKTRRGRLALIDSWQMKQKALDSLIFRFCASCFCFAACLLACLARMGPMRRHFYGQFAERQAVSQILYGHKQSLIVAIIKPICIVNIRE